MDGMCEDVSFQFTDSLSGIQTGGGVGACFIVRHYSPRSSAEGAMRSCGRPFFNWGQSGGISIPRKLQDRCCI